MTHYTSVSGDVCVFIRIHKCALNIPYTHNARIIFLDANGMSEVHWASQINRRLHLKKKKKNFSLAVRREHEQRAESREKQKSEFGVECGSSTVR